MKILFLIHDLGQGGAEKVLVNLVNNMDKEKFDISVIALFGGGVNEQFLEPHIHYKSVWKKEFPGNSEIMKLLSPKKLHDLCIKEKYDIEISYLEGPSARVVSGCGSRSTKLVSWIHVEQHTMKKLSGPFRNKRETIKCYSEFDHTVCVSKFVHDDFQSILNLSKPCSVIYNTVESEKIRRLSLEEISYPYEEKMVNMIAVGSLKETKGFDRLIRIVERLKKHNYKIHLRILGKGPLKTYLEEMVKEKKLEEEVTFLGYDVNPYKYVEKSDLFICASRAEGFSTAATEALIVGTPVCTVDVSGMKEMLGENNEYGIVVENDDEALYEGIKGLLDSKEKLEYYTEKAVERGKYFNTNNTVKAVENMLYSL